METRRTFIRKTGLALTAAALVPSMGCGKADPKTGLALYTIRQDMTRDAAGTLAAVAAMGYNWVEAASYSEGKFYGMAPADFRRSVEDNGLKLISTHNGINRENAEKMTDDAATAGLKYLILPSLWTKTLDGFKEAADFLNYAGEMCKSKGLKFGFHNHSIEFTEIDGIVPFDILAEDTDPNLVIFEIDLCWVVAAGKDPVDYFNKYPGRFELWHFKDMSTEKRDATMGEGVIDFVPIYAAAKKSGLKYHFIEQDNSTTHAPLESARISRDFLINNIL